MDAKKAEKLRDTIVEKMLPNVPFDGWSSRTMKEAAKEADIDASLLRVIFPGGEVDAVMHYSKQLDQAFLKKIEAVDLASMRVRERVTYAVRTRIELMAEYREAGRRAAALFSLPFYAPLGTQALYRTVDAIWNGIGDTSTDFNFYTKRAILAGVYASVLLIWFDDRSEGFEKTWSFLDRRIADVMQIEKIKAGVRGVTDRLPSPASLLGALRYPARRF